jgi:dTMP kinase
VRARGRLLVFEGAEGVGKTTQVARLVARLARAGAACEHYREPGGTPLGDAVRALLLDPAGDVAPRAEALLFMAARAQLGAHVGARLRAGAWVVLDRFFLSTYAYQIAGRGLPAGEVRAANALATAGLVPDLTVLLALDPAVARARMVARGGLDRMEREDAAFHARVGAAFLSAATRRGSGRSPRSARSCGSTRTAARRRSRRASGRCSPTAGLKHSARRRSPSTDGSPRRGRAVGPSPVPTPCGPKRSSSSPR